MEPVPHSTPQALPEVRRNASFNHVPKKRKVQPVDDGPTLKKRGKTVNATIETNYQMALSGICPVLASLNKDDGMAQDSPPPRNLYSVFKFGGSSVGTPSRLRSVISTIERLASGNSNESPKRLAVVVSAQGNTTDWLLDAADYATSGNLEAAEACVDRVAELAIANAVAVDARVRREVMKHKLKKG